MFTSLYIKTNYSLLSSLVSIDKLITFAKTKNIKALAICDDNMLGVMHFYKECKNNGIKPIIGLDIKYNESHFMMYAQNYEGYKSLIKLSTITSDRPLTIADLEQYNQGVIVIIPYDSKFLYPELNNIYKELYLGYANVNEEEKLKTITPKVSLYD